MPLITIPKVLLFPDEEPGLWVSHPRGFWVNNPREFWANNGKTIVFLIRCELEGGLEEV